MEEFHEACDGDLEIAPLNQALKQWEHIYNHIRPHQALGYKTPNQFYRDWPASNHSRQEVLSDMS